MIPAWIIKEIKKKEKEQTREGPRVYIEDLPEEEEKDGNIPPEEGSISGGYINLNC